MRNRLRSFSHAFRGLSILLRTQTNARIHLAATVAVVVLAILLEVKPIEWAVLLLAVSVVWSAEALNSSLEQIADRASPEWHPLVQKAKDMAAGAVLLAAIAAAAVGVLVFYKHL
ncbi:diacylglycerol kinase family protein [Candidatus Fermentibacteria bacterium]|nr:diacylglycerol kinase family protein [Candidatus Fermentibacteria bacterium]